MARSQSLNHYRQNDNDYLPMSKYRNKNGDIE